MTQHFVVSVTPEGPARRLTSRKRAKIRVILDVLPGVVRWRRPAAVLGERPRPSGRLAATSARGAPRAGPGLRAAWRRDARAPSPGPGRPLPLTSESSGPGSHGWDADTHRSHGSVPGERHRGRPRLRPTAPFTSHLTRRLRAEPRQPAPLSGARPAPSSAAAHPSSPAAPGRCFLSVWWRRVLVPDPRPAVGLRSSPLLLPGSATPASWREERWQRQAATRAARTSIGPVGSAPK